MPGERAAHPAHSSHEPFLIARYVEDDVSAAERVHADTLIASCSACRELEDDLRAIHLSLSTDMPTPRRPRAFRLSPADAERARSASPWDRFLRWVGGPKLGVLQPLGAAALSIGVAVTVVSGLGIAPGGSIGGPADAPAAAPAIGARPPSAGGGAAATQDLPERQGVTSAEESAGATPSAAESPAAAGAPATAAAATSAPQATEGDMAGPAETAAATHGAGEGNASASGPPAVRPVPDSEPPVDTEGATGTDRPRLQATPDTSAQDGTDTPDPTQLAYGAPGSTSSPDPDDAGVAAPARSSDTVDYRPVGIALALSGLLAILLRTYARRRPGDPFTR
jgi:hypothetical protein